MNEASAADLLRALRGLVASGAVAIELDLKRLDHMDSPVGVEADSNIWVYGSMPVCAVAFWQLGLLPGIAAVAASVACYFTVGRAYVRRRLARRVEERALQDSALWRRLWQFGGVALVERASGVRCVAPDGNWMALVRGGMPAREGELIEDRDPLRAVTYCDVPTRGCSLFDEIKPKAMHIVKYLMLINPVFR